MAAPTVVSSVSMSTSRPSADGLCSFAMTFPQLVNQALKLGIDESTIKLLRHVYDIAERMVDGLYRAQGTPFINHLVRTASILMAYRQPMEVVIAGMLHGVYLMNLFEGSRRREIRPADRAYLQEHFGHKVESLVWDYAQLPWGRRDIVQEH